MFALPASVRVVLATTPVDMRKSIDGLMALVRAAWGEDVYSGHLFAFVSRKGDRVKVLTWERWGAMRSTLQSIWKKSPSLWRSIPSTADGFPSCVSTATCRALREVATWCWACQRAVSCDFPLRGRTGRNRAPSRE
ncbi:IS66 family insertion sequence element accessory protein TnpB [Myxococcus sp. 1LA]